VHLLNFAEMPKETFGRQLAFNVVPDAALACSVPGLEAEIAAQVSALCGWDRVRLALRFIAAPLFYGHGAELRLRVPERTAADDLRAAWAERGLVPEADAGAAANTPMEVADEREIRIGQPSADGLGGFWLWAVGGRCGSRAAEMAGAWARRALG
jgi:hypothetical protein